MEGNPDLAQRCAEKAAGVTIPQLLHRNAVTYPDRQALTTFDGDASLTWREMQDGVAAISRGLAGLGVVEGDRVIMMMPSRIEHWLVDLAAVHLGAIPCTAYATLSTDQLRFLAQHSAAKVLVLNGEAELRKWQGALGDLPALRHIIIVEEDTFENVSHPGSRSLATVMAQGAAAHAADPGAFEAEWRRVRAEQPVTLLYTSGTTGDPKGVLLSHHNVIYQCAVLEATVPMPDHPRTVAYLPLAHIAERVLGIYNLIYRTGLATIVADPAKLVAAMRAVKPNSFFGVPRVWEKMAAGVQAQEGAHHQLQREEHLTRADREPAAGPPADRPGRRDRRPAAVHHGSDRAGRGGRRAVGRRAKPAGSEPARPRQGSGRASGRRLGRRGRE